MKYVAFLTSLFSLVCGHVAAQDATIPVVRSSLQNDTAIPGQPLLYRVSILVPTWLPSPPEFPSYEAPNVVVRLPSRASGPTSETIGGETWSGVTRSYRFYPMVEGSFRIPAGTIKVTYADPETQDPVVVETMTDSFVITGKVPSGAKALDPFLAANSATLDRTIDGTPQKMKIGDALTLKTLVKVTGVSPMFVPPFEKETTDTGLAFYPKEPVLEEKEDRGLLSGTRTEETVIIAETAGTHVIRGQTLSWYNLKSGKVEVVKTSEIAIYVAGTPAPSPTQEVAGIDWKRLLGPVVLLLIFGLTGFFLWRRFSLRVTARIHQFIRRYKASEAYLYKGLVVAVRSHDLNLVLQRGPVWQREIERQYPTVDWSAYDRALHKCSARFYSQKTGTVPENQQELWDSLMTAVRRIRDDALYFRQDLKHERLPQLNPI